MRSLAHDLGKALGTAAHLTALRRQASGAFHARDAWPLQQLIDHLNSAREAHRPLFAADAA